MQIQRVIELCVGLAFATTAAQSADLATSVKTKSYTKSQNSIYLQANLPLRCRTGDPIPLEIELKNSSSHDITWIEAEPHGELNLSIRAASGNFTELKDKNKATPGRFRLVVKTLHPQETHSWKIDLTEKFLLPPGAYRVSLSLGLNPPETKTEAKPTTISLRDMELNISVGNETSLPVETPRAVMPYELFLSDVGGKIGCHFTLEYQDYSLIGRLPAIRSETTNDLSEISATGLLSKLRRDLQGFTIVPDAKNPAIIHIIEQALEYQENYPLNRSVTLAYSGNLVGCVVKDSQGNNLVKGEGLVTTIAKNVEGLVSGSANHDGREAFDDCITEVTVNATNEIVRGILTGCVPLANYSTIVWRAVASKEGKKSKVFVQFYGPKHRE